jgi:hypothetical protein
MPPRSRQTSGPTRAASRTPRNARSTPLRATPLGVSSPSTPASRRASNRQSLQHEADGAQATQQRSSLPVTLRLPPVSLRRLNVLGTVFAPDLDALTPRPHETPYDIDSPAPITAESTAAETPSRPRRNLGFTPRDTARWTQSPFPTDSDSSPQSSLETRKKRTFYEIVSTKYRT